MIDSCIVLPSFAVVVLIQDHLERPLAQSIEIEQFLVRFRGQCFVMVVQVPKWFSEDELVWLHLVITAEMLVVISESLLNGQLFFKKFRFFYFNLWLSMIIVWIKLNRLCIRSVHLLGANLADILRHFTVVYIEWIFVLFGPEKLSLFVHDFTVFVRLVKREEEATSRRLLLNPNSLWTFQYVSAWI